MEKFGWCFIGSGSITKRVLKDFPLMDGAYLASVYSPTYANAKKLANAYGARAYDTLEAAVADPNVQAVYVATTNNAHKEHTLGALAQGKPVLCEKPFALSRSEAEEMMAMAKQQHCYLIEAMWTRFNPAICQTMDWLQKGYIGQVTHTEASFAFESKEVSPRIAQNALGGGSLLDLGVYPLSLAQFANGDAPPDMVHASANMTPEGVDSECTLMLRYQNGATARLFSSIEVDSPNDAVIYGEKGTISLPNFVWCRQATLTSPEGSKTFTLDEAPADGYHYEFNAVMDDIRKGRLENALVTHAHTLRIMDIMDAARKEIGLRFGTSA